MKQMLFLVTLLSLGGFGSILHPFWGLLTYYTIATLRPQDVWEWALPVQFRWSMAAAILLLLGIALNLNRVVHAMRINLVMVLMLIFALLIGLSCLTAYDPDTATRWATLYAKILLICFVTGLLVTELWQVRALCIAIFLSLAYLAWDVNTSYIFQGRLTIFHAGLGDLDNNGAAMLMGLTIPFAYAFAVSPIRMWQRAISVFCALLALHAVMLSYSRGAMVAVSCGLLWLILHHHSRAQKVVMVIGLVAALTVMAGPEVQKRFVSTASYDQENTAQLRFASWGAAWRIANEHPFGVGVRNSNAYTHSYGADKLGRTVHNQYLQLAADSGIPTMLVYVLLIITVLVMMFNARRACLRTLAQRGDLPPSDDEPRHRQMLQMTANLALGCQTAIIIFAVDSLFLSMEVVEVPWLLMAVAGTVPAALHTYLRRLNETSHQSDAPTSLPEPALKLKPNPWIKRFEAERPGVVT